MAGNSPEDRVRKGFEDQFELAGDGYLYRHYLKGAPLPVSAAERDQFIQSFNAYLKYAKWGIFAGTIFILGIVVAVSVETRTDISDVLIYLLLGALGACYMASFYWARNAPMRALRNRMPIGEARSREELKRVFFSKLSYWQIVSAIAPAVVLLLWRPSANYFSGWGLFRTVLATSLIALALLQAFQKWRLDQTKS